MMKELTELETTLSSIVAAGGNTQVGALASALLVISNSMRVIHGAVSESADLALLRRIEEIDIRISELMKLAENVAVSMNSISLLSLRITALETAFGPLIAKSDVSGEISKNG